MTRSGLAAAPGVEGPRRPAQHDLLPGDGAVQTKLGCIDQSGSSPPWKRHRGSGPQLTSVALSKHDDGQPGGILQARGDYRSVRDRAGPQAMAAPPTDLTGGWAQGHQHPVPIVNDGQPVIVGDSTGNAIQAHSSSPKVDAAYGWG